MDVHNFTTELELIQQFVKNGSSELFYFDESGFSLETNIPYAWQEINTTLLRSCKKVVESRSELEKFKFLETEFQMPTALDFTTAKLQLMEK
jgi:hypothetical protein